jgi:hypothetical protein
MNKVYFNLFYYNLYYKNKCITSNRAFNSSKHFYSQKFPIGEDCILSQLGLIRPSLLTHIRSVSDTLPYPIIADLGSRYAGCPIFFIITSPKFITLGHTILSKLCLVEKALRGFPNNKICCNSQCFK